MFVVCSLWFFVCRLSFVVYSFSFADACVANACVLTRMRVGVQACFDVMYRSRICESIVRTQSMATQSMASQSLAVRGSWSVVRCLWSSSHSQ